MPPVPTAHAFLELNVRTYVTLDGRPGVWFFSLDAASTLAVIGARLGIRLPYFRASMEMTPVTVSSATQASAGRSPARRRRSRRHIAGIGPAGAGGAGHARTFPHRTLFALCVGWKTHLARRHLSSALEPPGGRGAHRAQLDDRRRRRASVRRRAVTPFLQISGRAILVASARALTGTAFALPRRGGS